MRVGWECVHTVVVGATGTTEGWTFTSGEIKGEVLGIKSSKWSTMERSLKEERGLSYGDFMRFGTQMELKVLSLPHRITLLLVTGF